MYVLDNAFFLLNANEHKTRQHIAIQNEPINTLAYSVEEIGKTYHASMQYIFSQQSLINSSSANKASLFGRNFINEVKKTYQTMYGQPFPAEPNIHLTRLVNLMMLVMDDNRTLLLDSDIAYKGFIPAVYAQK